MDSKSKQNDTNAVKEFFTKFFKLKQNNTTVSTEVLAGFTTFMTMAYILAVNPNFLSAAGMDRGAVFTATALASTIACLAMALLANYPFALAPGMGLNAYFAFTIAPKYGWELALLAVFAEGIIFILLSFVNVREAIFNSIPRVLKNAVSVGIGLFIAFIGLKNAGIVVSNPDTSVGIGHLTSLTVVLAVIGVIITAVLQIKKVKGALFFGILATYGLGLICQMAGLYVPNPEAGMYSLYPMVGDKVSAISLPPSIGEFNIMTAFASDAFAKVNIFDFAVIVFSFLFVDIFDTIGTLIGVSTKAGFLDKDGKLPKLKEALLADAVGTTIGAAIGTSTVTTFVESASGVAEGGRTGLTSTVVGGLFLLSLIFSPIFSAIPGFATAPALIVVGFFMLDSITKIDFTDFTEGFPAFLTIIMMPLAYSIAEGLVFGFLSFVILKTLSGKAKEVNIVMWIIAALFLIKIILT